MIDNPRHKPSYFAALAAGAAVVAILSFTGAVWPYAPDDAARAHLAFANACAFVTFISTGFLLCAISLLPRGGWLSHGTGIVNAMSLIVFLIGIVIASIQVTMAMNAWFPQPPRMSAELASTLRVLFLSCFLILIGVIVLRLGMAIVGRLRKRR